jgi:hypothetical protein
MFALPYLSGTEFVTMLARFGYLPRSRTGGLAALQRETNVVIVPEASTLSPTLVRAILRTANVDPYDFLHVLDQGAEEQGPPSKKVA